jgi:hypothetical protein
MALGIRALGLRDKSWTLNGRARFRRFLAENKGRDKKYEASAKPAKYGQKSGKNSPHNLSTNS